MEKAGYVGSYKVKMCCWWFILFTHFGKKKLLSGKTMRFDMEFNGSDALEIMLMGVLHFGNLTSEEVVATLLNVSEKLTCVIIYCFLPFYG